MDILSVVMTSCRLWPVEKTFPSLLQFADRSLARAQGTADTRHLLGLARFLPLSRMSLATNWGARALLAIAAFLVLLQFVSHLPFGRRLVLEKELPADEGVTSAPESDQRWLGVQGTAASPLHPAGVAHLDHERVDVVSDGEFIEAGEPIEVIRVDGAFVVNRRGVVDSAGTYLNAPIGLGRLSPDLGARHAAALAITTVRMSW